MRERPILFSGPMVKAILDGRKTQTRRVMKPQPEGESAELSEWSRGIASACHDHNPDHQKLIDHSHRLEGKLFPFRNNYGHLIGYRCPYGFLGDRLWVRETWRHNRETDHHPRVAYRADGQISSEKWKPSIFMPRWASRITLELVGVRVERLNDITEEDAIAEGSQIPLVQLPKSCQQATMTERDQFSRIWDSINSKKHPWASNPWVWVIEFKRLEAPS